MPLLSTFGGAGKDGFGTFNNYRYRMPFSPYNSAATNKWYGAVWNPAYSTNRTPAHVISGNRCAYGDSPSVNYTAGFLQGAVNSGQGYVEFILDRFCIGNFTMGITNGPDMGLGPDQVCINGNTPGTLSVSGVTFTVASNYPFSGRNGSVVGIAADFTAGKAWFHQDGIYTPGNPVTATSPNVTWTGGTNVYIGMFFANNPGAIPGGGTVTIINGV